ncbi:MAG: FGGY-family carbohydrate kinase, partial [Balneolales bacterium]
MHFLGIDIGTSGCKALVFDESGKQLAISGRSYDIMFSDNGGAELNPDEVTGKCFDVIRECTSAVPAGSVKGLSISSQGEAFTAVGSNHESLCNAMVSSDSRSEPYLSRFIRKMDDEKLYRITGHTAHPLFTVFKLLWLKENKPKVWKKTRYFLCFEDLLQLRLGIEPTISWPLAGRTMMFDVIKKQWSPEILDIVGLTADRLAKPAPSGSIVGKIPADLAEELGLSKETVVVSGGHDQTCSALGAGVVDKGIAMLATGTVECITAAFKKPEFSADLKKNNLCTYNYTIPDYYASIAYHLTGGNILKWFKDEFGGREVAEAERSKGSAYEYLLKAMSDTPSGLMVLPYFTPSGTPYFDTRTKGAIFGLRLSTGRGELIRALLEGVAFEMRLNLEILGNSGYQISEFRAVGGGAKSETWTQLKADVMDKKITT